MITQQHRGASHTPSKPLPPGVPINPHDESVYHLIPVEYVPPPRPPRYKSQYAEAARIAYKAGQQSAASMGPAKVPLAKPTEFLRKHAHEKPLPTPHPKPVNHIPPDNTTPPLPEHSSKNYIVMNALSNIHSVARKPVDNHVDYRRKVDYGRVPDYLKEMQEEQVRIKAQEEARQKAEKAAVDSVYQPLKEADRLALLEGLKANWEKLNRDYQKLSLTVDTVPKITRKVNMEANLKRLEEDIAKFSHPNLYLYQGQ